MIQTQKNDKTPDIDPDLAPFGPNSATKFFYKTRRWTLFQAMINLKENK